MRAVFPRLLQRRILVLGRPAILGSTLVPRRVTISPSTPVGTSLSLSSSRRIALPGVSRPSVPARLASGSSLGNAL